MNRLARLPSVGEREIERMGTVNHGWGTANTLSQLILNAEYDQQRIDWIQAGSAKT
jgi:hypothetical protein